MTVHVIQSVMLDHHHRYGPTRGFKDGTNSSRHSEASSVGRALTAAVGRPGSDRLPTAMTR